MNFATISADIISYTSLSELDRRELESGIKELLADFAHKYREQGFFGRLVQGDHIECAMNDPRFSLRIALLLKTFVKAFDFKVRRRDKTSLKYFFEHGIRLAVAVAPLTKLDAENDIIDGEAIYLSGRAIRNLSTTDKQKIVIKNTMFFRSFESELENQFDTFFSLLDTIISKCSAKQCEVVFYKLLSFSEKEIAEKLGKNQSTISQHSTAAGWISIEKTIHYYERAIK